MMAQIVVCWYCGHVGYAGKGGGCYCSNRHSDALDKFTEKESEVIIKRVQKLVDIMVEEKAVKLEEEAVRLKEKAVRIRGGQ